MKAPCFPRCGRCPQPSLAAPATAGHPLQIDFVGAEKLREPIAATFKAKVGVNLLEGSTSAPRLSRLLRYDELALPFAVHSSASGSFSSRSSPDRHKLQAMTLYRAQTTDSGTRCWSEASAAIGTPWPSETPAN